jgi:DNA-binding GntR family transcriptional regulator
VKPISGEEIMDIAELRLALISLAFKPAYRYLSPADFEAAFNLAKQITRSRDPKDHFQCHSKFWEGIFSKAERPILREVFRQLNDGMARYEPLYFRVFPTPENRPRQREALIELYRKGKIAEAFLAFKSDLLRHR